MWPKNLRRVLRMTCVSGGCGPTDQPPYWGCVTRWSGFDAWNVSLRAWSSGEMVGCRAGCQSRRMWGINSLLCCFGMVSFGQYIVCVDSISLLFRYYSVASCCLLAIRVTDSHAYYRRQHQLKYST